MDEKNIYVLIQNTTSFNNIVIYLPHIKIIVPHMEASRLVTDEVVYFPPGDSPIDIFSK